MGTRATPRVRRAAALVTIAGAGVAFAGGSSAWASSTPATTATCGTPAQAALYRTVDHAAVPAVTHDVTVVDQPYVPGSAAVEEVSRAELTTVDGEGTPEGEGWTATGKTWTIEDSAAWTEYEWQRTVVDQLGVEGSPAVPAVTHEVTVVVTPAYTEKVIDAEAWTELVPGRWWNWSPNKDTGPFDGPPSFPTDPRGTWQGPHENGGPGQDEEGTFNTSNGNSGNGSWFHREPKTEIDHPEESHLVVHPAVTRSETVVDVPAVPAVPSVEEVSHVETAWNRSQDTSPEGMGWTLTGEERVHPGTSHIRYEWTRTVIDTPYSAPVAEIPEVSHTEVVVDIEAVPAWSERIVVSEAVPAGPPCAASPADITPPAAGAPPAGAPADGPTAVTTTVATPEALAQTGLDLTLPLGAGLAMVFVGGVLVAIRRVGAGR